LENKTLSYDDDYDDFDNDEESKESKAGDDVSKHAGSSFGISMKSLPRNW
jgi:hypothetical protein